MLRYCSIPIFQRAGIQLKLSTKAQHPSDTCYVPHTMRDISLAVHLVLRNTCQQEKLPRLKQKTRSDHVLKGLCLKPETQVCCLSQSYFNHKVVVPAVFFNSYPKSGFLHGNPQNRKLLSSIINIKKQKGILLVGKNGSQFPLSSGSCSN